MIVKAFIHPAIFGLFGAIIAIIAIIADVLH